MSRDGPIILGNGKERPVCTGKWKEKVLPSALTFGDALHQARLGEEQHKQLSDLHRGRPPQQPGQRSQLQRLLAQVAKPSQRSLAEAHPSPGRNRLVSVFDVAACATMLVSVHSDNHRQTLQDKKGLELLLIQSVTVPQRRPGRSSA